MIRKEVDIMSNKNVNLNENLVEKLVSREMEARMCKAEDALEVKSFEPEPIVGVVIEGEYVPIGSPEEAALLQKYRSKKQKYADKRADKIKRAKSVNNGNQLLHLMNFVSENLGDNLYKF